MRDVLEAPAGAIVLSERDEENLDHLTKAVLFRVDPAVIGLVCRRGGPRPGEDWLEASRVLAKTKRSYDLLPKLMHVVGEAAPALAIYRWQLVAAPSAADVLDGRSTVDPASPSILGEAAALAYALADRALLDHGERIPSFEAFARTVERDLPFRAGALACHMAAALIDLRETLDGVLGWEAMEEKMRAGLRRFAASRATA
jgi:hypothetical protein